MWAKLHLCRAWLTEICNGLAPHYRGMEIVFNQQLPRLGQTSLSTALPHAQSMTRNCALCITLKCVCCEVCCRCGSSLSLLSRSVARSWVHGTCAHLARKGSCPVSGIVLRMRDCVGQQLSCMLDHACNLMRIRMPLHASLCHEGHLNGAKAHHAMSVQAHCQASLQ